MYIISACFAGVNCKYNGKNNFNDYINKLVKEGKAILVCPEQLGGLPTPREPSEIVSYNNDIKVITKSGKDITENFKRGAKETLKIAKSYNISKAILKARSPSCGYGEIYDGTFSGKVKKGNGITSVLLSEAGIKIYSEENLPNDILNKNNMGE